MRVGQLAAGLGIGLVAGLAGTVAMTASQLIEMRLRHRPSSVTPARAAEKVLHIHPDGDRAEQALNYEVHFAYGTVWGAFRAMLDGAGLRGWPATAVHLAAIQTAGWLMLPGLKVAPPVKAWGAPAIAADMTHHVVYAVTAGLTYDALKRSLVTAPPRRAAARPGLPWGTLAAMLAAASLQKAPPRRERLRMTMAERLPAPLRDRVAAR